MMEDKVETGGARWTDPQTSHEAARSVDVSKLQAMVIGALKNEPGGLTVTEIARALGEPRDSVSPRMKALASKGLVHNTGTRRIPEGMARNQIVWSLTEETQR